MKNELKNILKLVQKISPNNVDTKEELFEILKANGGQYFEVIGNCIFTVNEFGILEGIGYDFKGDFKIWSNNKFGTFKKDAIKLSPKLPAIFGKKTFNPKNSY